MKIYRLSMAKQTRFAMARKHESDIPSNWNFSMSEDVTDSGHAFIEYSLMTEVSDYAGMIAAENINGNVWVVVESEGHGWGAMLYDKVMRYVSNKGGYLISNQQAIDKGYFNHLKDSYPGETSSDAQGVWDKYRTIRPDVEETEQGFRFRPDNQMKKIEKIRYRNQENDNLQSLGFEGAKRYLKNKFPRLPEESILAKLRSLGIT